MSLRAIACNNGFQWRRAPGDIMPLCTNAPPTPPPPPLTLTLRYSYRGRIHDFQLRTHTKSVCVGGGGGGGCTKLVELRGFALA